MTGIHPTDERFCAMVKSAVERDRIDSPEHQNLSIAAERISEASRMLRLNPDFTPERGNRP
jgi:hypothetical protein